jgi:ABC-2 type transport system permease protein
MRGLIKYLSIAKTQVSNSLAYPADMISRALLIVTFMWIFLQLWGTVYRSNGSETIGGLSLRETLWYLMMAEAIVLSKSRISRTIAESVKTGAIAYLLNKPYDFLLYHLSAAAGDSALRMVINILAGGALVWFLVGPPPDLAGWPLVVLAILAAWLIDFCISAAIGLLAFLTEDVAAFEWLYSKFRLILGGVLIPLDFFPEWLRSLAMSLPFSYTVYGPARLFVDSNLQDFINLFLVQIAWLGAMGLMLIAMYYKGTKWLCINGG